MPSLLLLLSKVPFRFESQATKVIFKTFQPQTNFTYVHCEKFLLENLKVGIDVAIFLFQLVVQIQTLVFLDQVPTHL